MPQSPTYRRSPEDEKFLLEQETYRLYGSYSGDVDWVRETLERLETNGIDLGYSDQDRAGLTKAREILDRMNTLAEFTNPNQPRDAHGRWTSDGTFNVQKAVTYLETNAKKQPPGPNEGQCAEYVRKAIARGGIVFNGADRPKTGYAKDYGGTLQQYGFDAVPSVGPYRDYPPDGYIPEPGDVVVMQGTSKSVAGHMAMFSGKQWISDFKQPGKDAGFWPGKTYADERPSFVIYRHNKRTKPATI